MAPLGAIFLLDFFIWRDNINVYKSEVLMSEKNEKKNNRWIMWTIIPIVLVLIVIACWLLFRGKETHVSTPSESNKQVAVECRSNGTIQGSFFDDTRAEKVSHIIKGLFSDNTLGRITYNYEASYSSAGAAETELAYLHAQHNKYLSGRGLDQNILKSTFSNTDERVKITMFTDADKIVIEDAQFFFLNSDDFQRFRSYNKEEFADMYKSKGFSCTIHE